MASRWRSLGVVLLVPWLTAASLGDYIPEPEVGYRAERVILGPDRRIEQTVYSMPGMERVEAEVDGRRTVTVTRADADQAITWVEGDAVYRLTAPIPEPHRQDFESMQVVPLGADEIDGNRVEVFQMHGLDAAGQVFGAVLWASLDHIVVRVKGAAVDGERGEVPFAIGLAHLEVGPQPAELFQPPADLELQP